MSSRPERPILVPKSTSRSDVRPDAPRGYLAVSKSTAASIVVMIPLLLVYEVGIWRLRGRELPTAVPAGLAASESGPRVLDPLEGDRNAIAAVTKGPLFIFGRRAMLAFNLIVAGALLWAVFHLAQARSLRFRIFPVMLAESALWAVLVAVAVALTLRLELAVPAVPGSFGGFWPKVVAAAGAGVYEEMLFRGVLLGVLYFIALNVLEMKRWPAFVAAIVAASAIFSLAHFITPGEWRNWAAFRFRLAAGLVLSVVFLTRGLGIAAWSHAIYNVWIFCMPA